MSQAVANAPAALLSLPGMSMPAWSRRALLGATVLGLHLLPLLAWQAEEVPPPRPQAVMVAVLAAAPGIAAPRPAPTPPARVAPSPARTASPPRPTPAAAPAPLATRAESQGSATPTPAASQAAESAKAPAPTASGAEEAPPRFEAAYLRNPQPPYPLMSRKLREEGRVRLRVLVSAQGRADSVLVHHSSGYPRLDEAARSTVLGWQFVAAQRQGQAVAGWVEVPILFNLEQ